jgi:cell division transport system permease protein
MARLRYYVEEATASLAGARASNLLAIGAIALALFVFGAFVLVTSALDRVTAGWSAAAEMSVYLRDDATADQRAAIEATLDNSGLVERRDFISKADAAIRFRRDFPDLAAAADGIESNPFPASLELRLRARGMSSAEVNALARSIGEFPGVADVRYDRQWLDRLARLIAVLRWTGLALASALALAAGVTIAAVVRLAMAARRDEVEIMELVGAPLAAIRGPFVLEGILQGGIGGLVALGLLRVAYEIVRVRVPPEFVALAPTLVRFLSIGSLAGILAGGMLVGCLGGYVAARSVR